MTSDPDLDDRDYVYALDVDFDFDAQLRAISRLLRRNAQADQELSDEIEDISRHARQLRGVRNEQAVEEWVERMHDSVYQDAAHSMAAVGMLAPFTETVFVQCFHGIERRFFAHADPATGHARWANGGDRRWDCRHVLDGAMWRKDMVRGVLQLADAVGLAPKLPGSLEPTLGALFAYRNKMFHCGFEWPNRERIAFARRLEEETWPKGWFLRSTTDGEPWVFYLSPAFVEHCLKVIGDVLDGIGVFVRDSAKRT